MNTGSPTRELWLLVVLAIFFGRLMALGLRLAFLAAVALLLWGLWSLLP